MTTLPRSPAAGPQGSYGLKGSHCSGCSVTVYPADESCPRCGGPAADAVLSGAGTLWTWTVQRYAPKSPPYKEPPGGFVPFALGYVELDEGVRVAAVLDVGDIDDPDAVRIGMPLTVVTGDGVPRARPTNTVEEEGS
ncbi:Zn-ribbon domain-containing OB-fold protein [Streptomyces endophyticus]|uniref:OB-fold domain-containing protein n=1 Tax=Streptomyces endophyticus TaxID=714166 RepID=A0ABU6F847_9ACTN|nr:OB-fold domain-containing protein [Streptomyces endophyticus]MEB8340207.1 OB-fold domain-containing protein [Streptomyces endophyticus]